MPSDRHARNILYLGYSSHRIRRELIACANENNWNIAVGPRSYVDAEYYCSNFPVDGVISHASASGAQKRLQLFKNIPYVTLHAGTAAAIDVPAVLMDHAGAGRLVGRHFIEFGFENIVAIGPPDTVHTMRYNGLSESLAMAGAKPAKSIELIPEDNQTFGKDLMLLIYKLKAMTVPVAIMAHTDNLAVMLVHACRRLNLAIPTQVAICGFDNDPIACELAPVPLSSVDTNPELQVREVTRVMADLLEGRPPPHKPILIPPKELVIRHTSGASAVGDQTLSRALSYIHRFIGAADLSIPEIAAAIGVSPTALFVAFRRNEFGTPLSYITKQRIEKAKSLLAETKQPIESVSTACGFASYNQMYKAFKRTAGKSPSSFRQ